MRRLFLVLIAASTLVSACAPILKQISLEEHEWAVASVMPVWPHRLDSVSVSDQVFAVTKFLFPAVPDVEFVLCLYGLTDYQSRIVWIKEAELAPMQRWSKSSFRADACPYFRFYGIKVEDSSILFLPFIGTAHSHGNGVCYPETPSQDTLDDPEKLAADSSDISFFAEDEDGAGVVLMIVCGPEKVGVLTRSQYFTIFDRSARKEEDF